MSSSPQFQGSFKHVFLMKHEIHVNKKGLYITQYINEAHMQKVQQL